MDPSNVGEFSAFAAGPRKGLKDCKQEKPMKASRWQFVQQASKQSHLLQFRQKSKVTADSSK